MASYIGVSGETLVQDMGVPDKNIALNGFQYLAYVRQQTVVSPDPVAFGGYWGPYGGRWGGGFYGAGPPMVTVWTCETTFMLQHDKVLSFTLRGNDCS